MRTERLIAMDEVPVAMQLCRGTKDKAGPKENIRKTSFEEDVYAMYTTVALLQWTCSVKGHSPKHKINIVH